MPERYEMFTKNLRFNNTYNAIDAPLTPSSAVEYGSMAADEWKRQRKKRGKNIKTNELIESRRISWTRRRRKLSKLLLLFCKSRSISAIFRTVYVFGCAPLPLHCATHSHLANDFRNEFLSSPSPSLAPHRTHIHNGNCKRKSNIKSFLCVRAVRVVAERRWGSMTMMRHCHRHHRRTHSRASALWTFIWYFPSISFI